MRMTIAKSLVTAALLSLSGLSSAEQLSGAAPDFTLKSNQGSNIRLEELKGEVVMLNFWASWCGPCRQEMPLMNDIFAKYEDLGFTILAVNVDEDSADADRFLKAVPVDFPVVYDSTSKVSEMYEVDAMPTTVMIDRDGNKRFLHRGYKPGYEEEYANQVKQLIRE
ncbi:redoxin [Oleiphilus sp. HI0068]|uniref:TlpA disulfide reductase family protein n=3 Tax=Oleiphilus TaxID=141450 RepID=UPI0007C2F13E|nr:MULTISPECIES: TlpA disulfide reductase family protein [unclassified Oleiphilus]KZY77994.1 redoxin [Oleiphilus sp. HI0068]KZY80470.1 redoxin [Oleiphilus sp. HI0069]KZZ32636.1 redoxin [Oleiphilus sp. HI0085]KZY29080.1 redoxin [Oleiphilus sp. HI0043]KZZ76721.1 redoxin [Oleiphilus sp. HI0132]